MGLAPSARDPPGIVRHEVEANLAKDLMNYKEMVETALKGVVREALARIAERGLPGNHYVYVTFRTHFPGVLMPEHLRKSYPDEMSIVLQHQFWGLAVHDDSFQVTLSFNNSQELLSVPFAAVTGFVDPSVEFGLQFKTGTADEEEPVRQAVPAPPRTTDDAADAPIREPNADNIVTLDKFRKD